ncbi:plant-specific TFIIB-related protein 1 [Mercurialis annua]|uniref:plant-specific TFIIB-related protein 1 n=1 Tax=Mercurialis annua TaxID=3986 RepID=UPI002160716C|nr:plant-specific TFIIB-related protein 1 [Mercurialis annua]
MKCPYCSAAQARCATTTAGHSITECTSCGRVVEEHQFQPYHTFHVRAQDNPLCLVTSDLPTLHHRHHQPPPPPRQGREEEDEDPFEPTGFITAFSTWSLEPTPLSLRSSLSFSGHLAELERILELTTSSSAAAASNSNSNSNSSTVVVDNLRAYMQIIDVASILGLDCDISDHAFQLFRDCCSATCLRNRSVEALATAALVQAIREAQEPRTLQEISIAANVPQKEIGKYIKILGEALQLSQPINSNSISVHMPRFCTLLQLNKSAQELATHIGEVVINKCFCTRRNPISISAAAIYLACQLEDKRKTQAEICKVTGLTEVTLRKVYKELLENWDDLLPSNYTPAVPPEKAFPTTVITSGRSSTPRVDPVELTSSSTDKDKQDENKSNKTNNVSAKEKEDVENNGNPCGSRPPVLQTFRQPWLFGEKNVQSSCQDFEEKIDKQKMDNDSTGAARPNQFSNPPASGTSTITWPFRSSPSSGPSPIVQPPPKLAPGYAELKGISCQNSGKNGNLGGNNK